MKHFSLSYRLIFILLLAVLAASLIPLLMLMTTVVPSADDFAFGAAARTAFAATGSVPAALRAAGRMTLDVYRSWQGSFSAVFLMALTPAVFGDGFYALTPVLMLLSLLGGTFCLVTDQSIYCISICRAYLRPLLDAKTTVEIDGYYFGITHTVTPTFWHPSTYAFI